LNPLRRNSKRNSLIAEKQQSGEVIAWQLILYARWMLMRRKRNGKQNTGAKLTTSVLLAVKLLLKRTQKNMCNLIERIPQKRYTVF